MPTGSGPCRFGQYAIFMEDLIRRLRIPDVAFMALSSDNSYVGMDKDFERQAWWAVVVSDTMEDIRSMLLAAAADPQAAMAVFEEEWRRVTAVMEEGRYGRLTAQLARSRRAAEGHRAAPPAGRGAHRQPDRRDLRAPRRPLPAVPDRAPGREGVRDPLRARGRVGALLHLARDARVQPGHGRRPQAVPAEAAQLLPGALRAPDQVHPGRLRPGEGRAVWTWPRSSRPPDRTWPPT